MAALRVFVSHCDVGQCVVLDVPSKVVRVP